jgi:MYXO-CTERM domain-containing protein
MNHLDYRRPRPHSKAASMPRAWLLSLGMLSPGLLSVAMAEPAWAAPTEICDLDCPQGTTCQIAPVACPAIACADDSADCPRCDGPGTPYCAPAACESDSDCGGSMKCAEHQVYDCGSGATAPAIAPAAGDGDEPRTNLPEPPPCESSAIRQCTPRWQLPCTSDSDCGAGFRCEEGEACSVPPFDPSSGEPPSNEVTCSPTGTFACVVVETACDDEADCPEDFVCVDNPNGTCSSSSSGETQCEPADPARVCAPRAVATPTTGGDVASATSGPSAEGGPTDYLGDDVRSPEASGCALNAASPASPLALLSTLGLGLAFGARRRRSTAG